MASFNPRTHTGCDGVYETGMFTYKGFNPRTHTGCDIPAEGYDNIIPVSIHAPTRGATF